MSRAHILIVDDDGALLHSAQRVLATHYEVLALRSAEEALEQAAAFGPALAVLDIRMGEMDGFELSSRLRALVPGIDVIFMTGVVHELDAQLIRSIREKAFYFIRKPFDRDVLLTLVERCLDVRRLAAENAAHLHRLQTEMAAARAFQVGLQPPESGRLQRLTIATRMQPCEDMSGDFLDYVDAGRGRVTVMLADVSGHGVSAHDGGHRQGGFSGDAGGWLRTARSGPAHPQRHQALRRGPLRLALLRPHRPGRSHPRVGQRRAPQGLSLG